MVHGCMVYTERAEMAAVSCGTSHASAVSTPLRWIFKKCAIKKKKLFTHVESHVSAVSLLNSGEQRYIKAISSSSSSSSSSVRVRGACQFAHVCSHTFTGPRVTWLLGLHGESVHAVSGLPVVLPTHNL